MKSIVFVIPTKNEENSLQDVLDCLQREAREIGFKVEEILVVDDSRDKTRDIARACGGRVLFGGGKGLGEAMYRGLKEAVNIQTHYIVSLDADGQANLKDLSKVLTPLEEGRADLVLTSRRLEKKSIKYRYPILNFFGIQILVFLLRRGTGLPLTDSHGGLRAMIPKVAEELEMIGTHTYVQETIFDAHDKGFRIVEVPSVWYPRQGKSRVLHSITKYVFSTLPVILLRLGWHKNLCHPMLLFSYFCLGILIFSLFSKSFGVVLVTVGFLGMIQAVVLEVLWNIIRRNNCGR